MNTFRRWFLIKRVLYMKVERILVKVKKLNEKKTHNHHNEKVYLLRIKGAYTVHCSVYNGSIF